MKDIKNNRLAVGNDCSYANERWNTNVIYTRYDECVPLSKQNKTRIILHMNNIIQPNTPINTPIYGTTLFCVLDDVIYEIGLRALIVGKCSKWTGTKGMICLDRMDWGYRGRLAVIMCQLLRFTPNSYEFVYIWQFYQHI